MLTKSFRLTKGSGRGDTSFPEDDTPVVEATYHIYIVYIRKPFMYVY